jgi:hypothetical protein
MIKRNIHFLFLAVLLFSGQIFAGTYIYNAGFELDTNDNGDADGWSDAPSGVFTTYENNPSDAYSGDDFGRITAGVDGWGVCYSHDIPVEPGVSYTFSAYIGDSVSGGTGNNPVGMVGLKVEWYANYGDAYDDRLGLESTSLTVSKSGTYANYSAQFTNTYGAAYARAVITCSRISGETRSFNLDDVYFERTYPLAKIDINGDKKVNNLDFAQFAQSWLSATNTNDVNGDYFCDMIELEYLANEWMRLPDYHSGYTLAWWDEFDGEEIDHSNWTHEVGDSWSNNEIQSYTARPDNSYVQDGDLVIVALNELYHGNEFTSCRIRTSGKADFKYGRIEARIKLPTGGGMWPAFWMMPTHAVYGGWAASGEIDILEANNVPTWIAGNLHFGGEWPLNTSIGSTKYYGGGGVDFSLDYHVYALEWETNEFRWYCDGNLYKTETSWWSSGGAYPAPFNQEFYIILNIAVGGDYTGCTEPSCITATFPQEMRIDYVRVYQ